MSTLEESTPVERFRSPEEELAYLRERVRIKETELESEKSPFERDRIAKREVLHYQDTPTHEVLEETYQVPEATLVSEQLRLEPEEHDVQMTELLAMVTERGIKNTLAVVKKMGSAHLEDDLHRVLVRYVAEGFPTKGVKQGSETWRALHMVLYEVSLAAHTDEQYELEKLFATMEQFYAGIANVVGSGGAKNQDVFSLEIAVQEGGEEAIFYVAVPGKRKDLFEKHMSATFPHAHIDEMRGDYNIFNYGGVHKGAYAKLEKSPAFPLKQYSEFSHDPLNILLSSFSQLQKHGEGAAIQFVVGDHGDTYSKQYNDVISYLRKGKSVSKAVAYGTRPFSEAKDQFKKSLGEVLFNKTDSGESREKIVDELALEAITKKVSSKIVPVTIRIVTSAEDETRAENIMENISASFNQFEEAQGNRLSFKRQTGNALRTFLHDFSFRKISLKNVLPLSLAELTSLYHLSGEGISTSRELKQSRAKKVAAPIHVGKTSDEGVVLGKNTFGGVETDVRFLSEDRMRHFYEIGQTGTGKTVLMKNMIIQDIRNGEGCCYIDPHGSDIVDVLAAVPPERYGDVIYFDPVHTQMPMGLNMMEYDPAFPEQKTFVVNELFSIFEKLFMKKSPESLGPMFEQYFRNAAMLVLEGMEPGTATIADIPRVLTDAPFRHACVARSQNPIVNQFWTNIAEQADGYAALKNIVPYITAKTDIFLSDEIVRPIIAQQQSAFNFRDILDNRKILLVNLSKGMLGDLSSELLGLIIVGKFLQAALSRVDVIHTGGTIPDFYLYIDEFQNFTTPSIAVMLSEIRKYRLSLNLAHQFIAQLDDRIRDAVFGNVGTTCVFRVGSEDAAFLEKQFQPEFSASDIAGLDNFNAYVSLLVGGKPSKPFNMVTVPPEQVDFAKVEELKQMSYHTYGRSKVEVEAEIAARYNQQRMPII